MTDKKFDISQINAESLLSDETFLAVYDCDDDIIKANLIIALRNKAKEFKQLKEFEIKYKSFEKIKRDLDKQAKLDIRAVELAQFPNWFNGSIVDEVKFCETFITENNIKCINGKIFNINGEISDGQVESQIHTMIMPFVSNKIAYTVKALVNALKIASYSEPLPLKLDEINLKAGVLNVSGDYSWESQFCTNRINTYYNAIAKEPKKWLEFLKCLLIDDDILTLQEFLGYCLIPSTKAQAMLFIIGNGGEGKSRIGIVIKELFSKSMISGSLQRIETDKFFRANLESKLLFLDDDLDLTALPSTTYIKNIVTAEAPIDIERKGIQSYQALLYSRIICFGNGGLKSLYDKSDGLFRRQIVLKTKPKPLDRTDNPFLADELLKELDKIFYWCFEGLQRLLKNNYRFTLSEQTKRNLDEAKAENCNVISFMSDDEYILFDEISMLSSKELYNEYSFWCLQNGLSALKIETVVNFIKNNADKYGIKYSEHILDSDNKRSRGFKGIKKVIRRNPYG